MALHVHSFFYFSFVIITVVVIFFAAPSVSQPQAAGSLGPDGAAVSVLVDADGAEQRVENGTVLSGVTVRDLKTAVATAGDSNQMQVRVDMVGTLLGVQPPAVPMPSSVTLANDGFLCGQSSSQGTYAVNMDFY